MCFGFILWKHLMRNNDLIEGFFPIAVSTEAISLSRSVWSEKKKNSWINKCKNIDLAHVDLLLSPMSRLERTRTPCMHDSSTWAPAGPSWLPLRSRCRPAVDSLHARPNSKCFNASRGILQYEMLRCLRLSVLVKNCLNDGGISLPFFVPNELWDTFKWLRCVEQPRKSAPNNCTVRKKRWTRH